MWHGQTLVLLTFEWDISNMHLFLAEFRGGSWGKTAKTCQEGKFDPDAVCGTAKKPGCDQETPEENQRGTHDGKDGSYVSSFWMLKSLLFYSFLSFVSSKKYQLSWFGLYVLWTFK